MDIATVAGLIMGLGALLVGHIMEGGTIGQLFSLSAAIIVMGGSTGAAVVMQPLRNTLILPIVLKKALLSRPLNPPQIIDTMATLARIARRDGVLALENELQDIPNEFTRRGIQLVVDGTDPQVTQEVLETEIYAMAERHEAAAKFFHNMGGLTPTLGVVGTVMGLTHVLTRLEDPGSMGPAIATAFLATFYGVASANLIFLPIANKLKVRSEQEQFACEIIAAGVSSIQSGETPTVLREHLKAYLSPKQRTRLTAAQSEPTDEEEGGADESAQAA